MDDIFVIRFDKLMNLLRRKPKLNNIYRVIAWIIGIFISLLIVFEVIFIVYEDEIADKVVSFVNNSQTGEIEVSSISFSPLSYFPDISLRLNEVQYFENKSDLRRPGDKAFCRLSKFYISLDLFDLISGNIDVSELTLKDGELLIRTREDGSNNLSGLFNVEEDSISDVPEDNDREKIDLQLNKFTLENIRLIYENIPADFRADVFLTEFENHLTFIDNHLNIQLQPQIDIVNIEKGENSYLKNTELQMLINFRLNMDSLKGHIDKSWIKVEGANLNIKGILEFKNDIFLDLNLASAVNDPSLLYFLFDDDLIESNLPNIQEGNIYFDGSIKGNIGENIPFTEIKFGINNLHLKIPNTVREIKNFNFDGYFTTGHEPDLSDAMIRINNLSSEGPAGRSTGSFNIQNFAQPEIELTVDGNIDLSRIEKIFKFVNAPVYSGVAKVKGSVQAVYDLSQKKLIQKKGSLQIELEDFSFLIMNTGKKCNKLNGKIKWQDNKFCIENLTIKAEPTDILLNGEISSIVNHLLGIDSKVTARIKLLAETIDFNTFLTEEDVAPWILDEYCQNVDVDIEFTTESKKLRQDSELPPGQLKINNLKINLKNVSDVEIYQGIVEITNESLDIRNINAKIEDNRVIFSSIIDNYEDLFANDYLDSCQISLNLRSNTVRLKDFFTYKNEIYLPDYWKKASYSVFNLDATLTLPQNPDSGMVPAYEFDLKVRNLSGVNTNTTANLRNVSTGVQDTGDDLVFRDIHGQFGQTIFKNSNLDLINLFSDDKKFRIKSEINCNYLNLNEWLDYVNDSGAEISDTPDKEIASGDSYDMTAIPSLDLKANITEFRYSDFRLLNMKTRINTEEEGHLYNDTRDSTWWLPDLNLTSQIDSDSLLSPYFHVPETKIKLILKDGILEIFPSYRGLFGAEGSGHIWLDISKRQHSYRIQYSINNFKLETFLSRFDKERRMSGIMHMSLDLYLEDEDLAKLTGNLLLKGNDLTVYNLDIDELLTRFERTQSFNLVDLSAFLLAGPAGALVTKASDYAVLLNVDPSKQSIIKQFISSWEVTGGTVMAEDVALTTSKSRIALKGGIDLFRKEFVDFTLGVVDKKGCSLISQTVRGSLSKPELGQINAASTILAPVTNVLKLITGADCEPFYTGSVAHPEN